MKGKSPACGPKVPVISLPLPAKPATRTRRKSGAKRK